MADETNLGRLTRLARRALPAVGGLAVVILGGVKGLPAAILALAAGLLFGAIMFFWASLRVLEGEVPLPAHLESLDGHAQGIDILASRKKMLMVSLKDLERERALGKLENEDYASLSLSYREELKGILRKMDRDLEPYRERAENVVREYFERRGIGGKGETGGVATRQESERDSDSRREPIEERAEREHRKGQEGVTQRVPCAECGASNEMDARFCKGCGGELGSASSKGTDPSC